MPILFRYIMLACKGSCHVMSLSITTYPFPRGRGVLLLEPIPALSQSEGRVLPGQVACKGWQFEKFYHKDKTRSKHPTWPSTVLVHSWACVCVCVGECLCTCLLFVFSAALALLLWYQQLLQQHLNPCGHRGNHIPLQQLSTVRFSWLNDGLVNLLSFDIIY